MQPLSAKNMQEELEFDVQSLQNETQQNDTHHAPLGPLSHGATTENLKDTVATNLSKQKKVTASAFPSSMKKKHDRAKYINQKSAEFKLGTDKEEQNISQEPI